MSGFTDRTGLEPPDRRRPVVVDVTLIEARIKSLLVVDAARVTAWLPRSEILALEEGGGTSAALAPGQKLRLTIPAWLAQEKGLRAEAGAGQGRLL